MWFIDQNATDSTNQGTFDDPYLSIDNINNGPDAPGDFIFVYSGNYDSASGVMLENNQMLLGQSVPITVVLHEQGVALPPLTSMARDLPPVSSSPILSSSHGDGIILGMNNSIHGLTIGDTPSGWYGIVDSGKLHRDL